MNDKNIEQTGVREIGEGISGTNKPGVIKEVNSIFEQPWWLNIVAPGRWKEIRLEQDGLFLRWVYCKKGNKVYMPRDTQSLGIYLWQTTDRENDNLMPNINLQKQTDILLKAIEKLPKSNHIDICLSCNNSYVLPFLWKDYIITPRWTYRINDLHNIDEIYDRFSNTVKKNIKKSSKKVKISTEYKFEYLKSVLDATYRHQNRKNPENYSILRQLTDSAIENHAGKMFTAVDDNGNIHACSFILYDENVCYAWCGGSNPQFRNSGAKSLIWYEAIKFASGVSRVFDFEGSMIESIENFVKQFGGIPTVYYNVEKRSLLRHVFLFYKRKIKRLIHYKQ